VRISKTGICGSDVHYLLHGAIGDFTLEKPMCLGHESSGTVVEVGPFAVGRHAIGDRVALEPGYGCRTCDDCKVGRYNVSHRGVDILQADQY
jgi:D-xylulose reductase